MSDQQAIPNQISCVSSESAPAQSQCSKKKGTKQEVFNGIAERTGGGLTKQDLMENKKGQIISKKRHEHGKKALKNIQNYHASKEDLPSFESFLDNQENKIESNIVPNKLESNLNSSDNCNPIQSPKDEVKAQNAEIENLQASNEILSAPSKSRGRGRGRK